MDALKVSPVRAALIVCASFGLALLLALSTYRFFVHYIDPKLAPARSAPVPAASSAPENLAVDCPFAYRHLVAINCEHSERWVDLCQAAERAGVSMHLVCVEASENCTMAKKCLGEP
jgi:hypothetical protein